jgi:hypothetical protein
MRNFALPAFLVIGIAVVAWTAQWPNPYSIYGARVPPPHPYPYETVLLTIGLMTVQASTQIVVLRPTSYARSWGRAFSAAAITIPFLVLAALNAMHSPPLWFFYFWWIMVIAVGLVALGTYSFATGSRAKRVT